MRLKRYEWSKIPWFAILILIFAVIKQALAGNLPLVTYPIEKFDDGWMIKLAYNIANHSWLGNFNNNTLMKELIGPIYLAICSRLGLSFIGTTTFLYTYRMYYFCLCNKRVITY